ncbi:hypothetical protein ACJX0J_035275, partial [Zea mays]
MRYDERYTPLLQRAGLDVVSYQLRIPNTGRRALGAVKKRSGRQFFLVDLQIFRRSPWRLCLLELVPGHLFFLPLNEMLSSELSACHESISSLKILNDDLNAKLEEANKSTKNLTSHTYNTSVLNKKKEKAPMAKSLGYNLLSISQLCHMGYNCLFTNVDVSVFRRSDGSLAFKG